MLKYCVISVCLLAIFVSPVFCQHYVGNADLDASGVVDATDLIIIQKQWKTPGSGSFDIPLPQNRNLPSSYHADAGGMEYFYNHPDGFGPMTNVDYQTLGCKNCHVTTCKSCHDQSNGTYNPQTSCLNTCHSRQKAEISQGFTDVHNSMGFTCSTCHPSEQFHGDGIDHVSMLAADAPRASCAQCHDVTATTASVPEHAMHLDGNGRKLDCKACHVKSVITCYNCHFDSEVNGLGKIPFGQKKNYVMLVNDTHTNMVTTATYQSLYHDATDKSFVVFAPFYSHSITKDGRTCGDCHNNNFAKEYNLGNNIVVTQWTGSTVSHATGVIPVTADKMEFQYVNLTNPTAPPAERVWEPVKTVSDGVQFGFCEPLSATQTVLLAAPMGGKSE